MYAGAKAPKGYLFCDGSAVGRRAYSELFEAIGTTYGAGNGTTTFNLPDLRGRATFGRDDMGGAAAGRLGIASGFVGTAVGWAAGEQTHTLTTAEMPAHAHGVTDPGHTHVATAQAQSASTSASTSASVSTSNSTSASNSVSNSSVSSSDADSVSAPAVLFGGCNFLESNCPYGIVMGNGRSRDSGIHVAGGDSVSVNTSTTTGTTTATDTATATTTNTQTTTQTAVQVQNALSLTGVSVNSTGGGTAHNNMPPAMVMNAIIKY